MNGEQRGIPRPPWTLFEALYSVSISFFDSPSHLPSFPPYCTLESERFVGGLFLQDDVDYWKRVLCWCALLCQFQRISSQIFFLQKAYKRQSRFPFSLCNTILLLCLPDQLSSPFPIHFNLCMDLKPQSSMDLLHLVTLCPMKPWWFDLRTVSLNLFWMEKKLLKQIKRIPWDAMIHQRRCFGIHLKSISFCLNGFFLCVALCRWV